MDTCSTWRSASSVASSRGRWSGSCSPTLACRGCSYPGASALRWPSPRSVVSGAPSGSAHEVVGRREDCTLPGVWRRAGRPGAELLRRRSVLGRAHAIAVADMKLLAQLLYQRRTDLLPPGIAEP